MRVELLRASAWGGSGAGSSSERPKEAMLAWHVAKTKPRLEPQTAVVLEARGLQTYFPMIAAGRRPRRQERLEPLFPGYLFVRLDSSTPDWVVARSAPGISYFLGIDVHGSDVRRTPVA